MVEKRPDWERGSMASYSLASKKLLLIMLRVATMMTKMTTMMVMAIIDGSSAVLIILWMSFHQIPCFMGMVSPTPQMKKGRLNNPCPVVRRGPERGFKLGLPLHYL